MNKVSKKTFAYDKHFINDKRKIIKNFLCKNTIRYEGHSMPRRPIRYIIGAGYRGGLNKFTLTLREKLSIPKEIELSDLPFSHIYRSPSTHNEICRYLYGLPQEKTHPL